VGTGRFAEALGVDIGVDPASRVLPYAKRRGLRTLRALGHALPFQAGEFGAVFVIVTLCFADDAEGLLREASRVTRADGGIVLGIVPAGSPWGTFYAARARAGHAFYSEARFFSFQEVADLARGAQLCFNRSVSTLFKSPDDATFEIERPRDGEDQTAGFVAMRFRPGPQPAGNTTGPAREDQDGEDPRALICMRENTEIDPRDPRCPYPSSQCRFREQCPVRKAMRPAFGTRRVP